MSARRLTGADLAAFIGPADAAADVQPFLDAGAVLADFDMFGLRPAGGAARGGLPDGLMSRCEPISDGPRRGRWTVSLVDRRAALRRLVEQGTLAAARDANRADPTPEQRMLDALLGGLPPQPDALSRAELVALIGVLEWVDGIVTAVPARSAVHAALARLDLLAPMRDVVSADVLGREGELAQLDRYVFGEPPAAPLFVHGPGGVGKSTLLARFILDCADARRATFAYLDLDRPTIRPDRPTALLLHILEQVSVQAGLDRPSAASTITEISYAITRFDEGNVFESANAGPSSGQVIRLFSDYVDALGTAGPLLVVVDTFEEAQFLGVDVVHPLLEFLFELARATRTRVVIAGRGLPEEYEVVLSFTGRRPPEPTSPAAGLAELEPDSRPINLTVLDLEPARELLRRAVFAAGLPALTLAEIDEVIGVVGRNPMSLQLAARLLAADGLAGLRESRSEFFARLKAEKVQALLYGRILRQLHSPDVRKIAYPGLVLRRLTPDVIREVLAGPCGLELTAARNEYVMFEELAVEAGLVERDPNDGSLRHRVDVRRAVLDDIVDNVPDETIDEINGAAIAFYEGRPTLTDRAEEIYHRLRSAQPPGQVEARWLPAAADLLRNAVPELPPEQQLWLAQRLGVTLDESVRRGADLQVWERQVATSAERWLQSGAGADALAVLRERPDRSPRSPLYSLETEALRMLGRSDEARDVARAGVEAAGVAGAVDMAVELLLKIVAIEEGRGALPEAEHAHAEAAGVVAHSPDRMQQFRVEVTGLRLLRKAHPDATDELTARRAQVLERVTDPLVGQLRMRPTMLREAAAELGMHDARITSAAIQALGVEVTDDEQARAFGEAIVHAVESPSVQLSDTFNAGASELDVGSLDGERVRDWVHGTVTAKDTRSLGRALGAAESGDSVLGDFRTYFRAGVDSALREAPDQG